MFCLECGGNMKDGATFCTGCGAPAQVRASKLPMAEYLAMNPDYQKRKKRYDDGNMLRTWIGVMATFAFLGLTIGIGVAGPLNGGELSMFFVEIGLIVVVSLAPLIVVGVINSKAKRNLENYGARLYQQYLVQ